MSTTIDNRVVKMTFDNAQFEKGIKETIKSLTDFESKLNFKGATAGFDKIKEAANKAFESVKEALDGVADDIGLNPWLDKRAAEKERKKEESEKKKAEKIRKDKEIREKKKAISEKGE